MVDILTHLLAAHTTHLMAGGLPTGLSHNPTSVSGAMSGLTKSVVTVTDALPPLAGATGGSIAGYHAVAKAASVDPQKISQHQNGIKHGLTGGLVGIGAMSIITILAHIL